jgi:hypothetical protein
MVNRNDRHDRIALPAALLLVADALHIRPPIPTCGSDAVLSRDAD